MRSGFAPSSRSQEPIAALAQSQGGLAQRQPGLPALRGRPLAFLFGYIRRHPAGHLTVLLAMLIAVICSVSTQFGMKHLIDIVSPGRDAAAGRVWGALRPAVRAGGGRQSVVARRRLHGPSHVRRCHRRYPARPVPPSVRPFAELFRRAPARAAWPAGSAPPPTRRSPWKTPAPGTLCRRLSRLLLSIALIGSVNLTLALTLTALAACLGALVFALARRGTGRAPRLCRQGRRGRWRTGRCHQQLQCRAGIRRDAAGAVDGSAPRWTPK